MKIISKFHDFYDVVQKQGFDPNIKYIRETQKIILKDVKTYQNRSSYNTVEGLIFGYCGEIILGFKVSMYHHSNPLSIVDKIYYNLSEFKKDMIENGIFKNEDFTKPRFWGNGLFNFINNDHSQYKDLFHKYQTPLFLISSSGHRDSELTINPFLKEYNFQTCKETYTAYQDISQYVSGVLNGIENKMIKISDKDKIAKHGFDKWSFRKQSKDFK